MKILWTGHRTNAREEEDGLLSKSCVFLISRTNLSLNFRALSLSGEYVRVCFSVWVFASFVLL